MAARYLTLTWAEFHRDARRLADLAAKHGPYQGIVAVSRGGLIPAAILAHALSVRLIECVSVATYDQANRGRFRIRVKSSHKTDGGDHLCFEPAKRNDDGQTSTSRISIQHRFR